MLFARGDRPDRAALADFVALDIALHSCEPTATTDTPVSGTLKLVRDGLPIILGGLDDGAPGSFPSIEHRFDLETVPSADRYERLQLTVEPGLPTGDNRIEILRALIGLARDLAAHFENCAAIAWPPARSAISRKYFESTASAWIEGGPFPALGLTAFEQASDGAIHSIGLDFWIGRELLIDAALVKERTAAIRFGARLVSQLVVLGGITESERVVAPDGSHLVLHLSSDGKTIHVAPE